MTGTSLVVSDVDGTLVTPDKRLTDAAIQAVRLLGEKGIGFTIVSSRPPVGLRMFVEPLALSLPIGAFSGGTIVGPDLAPVEQHVVPESAARQSLDLLAGYGADAWVFTAEHWLLRDPRGGYVARERWTLQAEPRVVSEFDPYLAQVCKIVGSSNNFARLAECELAMRQALGEQASVARSQSYYLDVTPPGLDKGTFVEALARRLKLSCEAIAVLGDGENDIAMFRKAGLAIAMENASPEVKGQAMHLTASNANEGFALAIERFILEDAPGGQARGRS